jgi:hypothetical protein
MPTPQQQAILKAYVEADPVLSLIAPNLDGAYAIAAVLNMPAVPAFAVWRTEVPVAAIRNALTLSSYTPNDAADNTATFTNRLLVAQAKQINMQIMLQGSTTLDCSGAGVRNDLRDALIQLPTGRNGALVSAGGASGATVLNVCHRPALLVEKLLAGEVSTTGGVTANVLTFEGQISPAEVSAAMGWG